MPSVEGAGALDFNTIKTIVDSALRRVKKDQINTLYWHDSLHKYAGSNDPVARRKQWKVLLKEYFEPLVRQGKVEWKTFAEMVEIYKEHEESSEYK